MNIRASTALFWHLTVVLILSDLDGQASPRFDEQAHKINVSSSSERYFPVEVVAVPFGTGPGQIPKYRKIISEKRGAQGRAVPVFGDFMLLVSNVSESGRVLLATGGPRPEDRSVRVWNDEGKTILQCRHNAPWLKSIVEDDEGQVCIFVGGGYELSPPRDGVVIDRRHGRSKRISPPPSFMIRIDNSCNATEVGLPELTQGDFALGITNPHWAGRVPFVYEGWVYAGSSGKRALRRSSGKAKSHPRQDLPGLFDIQVEVSPDGHFIVVGSGGDFESAMLRRGGRVSRYQLMGLAKNVILADPVLIGGNDQAGYYLMVSVKDELGASLLKKIILRLNPMGRPLAHFILDDPRYLGPSQTYTDWKGNLYFSYLSEQFLVVKWSRGAKGNP